MSWLIGCLLPLRSEWFKEQKHKRHQRAHTTHLDTLPSHLPCSNKPRLSTMLGCQNEPTRVLGVAGTMSLRTCTQTNTGTRGQEAVLVSLPCSWLRLVEGLFFLFLFLLFLVFVCADLTSQTRECSTPFCRTEQNNKVSPFFLLPSLLACL